MFLNVRPQLVLLYHLFVHESYKPNIPKVFLVFHREFHKIAKAQNFPENLWECFSMESHQALVRFLSIHINLYWERRRGWKKLQKLILFIVSLHCSKYRESSFLSYFFFRGTFFVAIPWESFPPGSLSKYHRTEHYTIGGFWTFFVSAISFLEFCHLFSPSKRHHTTSFQFQKKKYIEKK